jgi:hypothetical protein
VFSQDTDSPLGGPRNPISTDILRDKVFDCVAASGRKVAVSEIDQFIAAVERIEELDSVRDIFDAFR